MGRRGAGKNRPKQTWRNDYADDDWGPAEYRMAVQQFLSFTHNRPQFGYGDTADAISEVVGTGDAETVVMTPEMLWELVHVARWNSKVM